MKSILPYVLLYLIGFGTDAYCQSAHVADLETLLKGTSNNSEKCERFNVLFKSMKSDSLQAYEAYIDEYEKVADDQYHRRYVDLLRAQSYYTLGEYSNSDSVASSSLEIFKGTPPSDGKTAELEIKTEILRSIVLTTLSKAAESSNISYNLISKIDSIGLIYSDVDSDELLSKNYLNLINLYLFNMDSLANIYVDKYLEIGKKGNSKSSLYQGYDLKYYANYYGANGVLLNDIADSCIYYAEMLNEPKKLGSAFMHKCNAMVELGKAEEGLIFCEKAESEFSKINDTEYLANILSNLANVFVKSNDYEKAIPFYIRSYEYASASEKPELFLSTLSQLAKIELEKGDYKSSAEHFNIFADSVYVFTQNQLDENFAQAEEKFQNAQKQLQIEEQNNTIIKQKLKNRLTIGGGLLLLLAGGGVFLWYRSQQELLRKKADIDLKAKEREAAQLKELDELKTQFFTNVSHELRTPLTLITGPLEEALKKNEFANNEIQLAYSNSKRLLSITNEILDLSKLESGKYKVNLKSVNLYKTIQRFASAFDSFAESKGVKLEISNRISQDGFYKIDVEKVEKILNNLLSNAIKFTDEGKVTFDAFVYQGNLCISVSDNGPGITLGDEEKIFDRFYQSKLHSSKYIGGTGVGLALTKELTELLGGKVDASNGSASGAVFNLELPVMIAEEEKVDKEEVSDLPTEKIVGYSPILINGEKPRILIVEDNREMCEYISSILSDDYYCDIAYDGYECLQKIQKEKYDIISSDVMMPKMNGFELKERINKMEKVKNIPFLFLTARVLDEDKVKGLRLGVDDYVCKPFNKMEYLTRINNLLTNNIERGSANFKSDKEESVEKRLLREAEEVILKNIDNTNFKVQDLASSLNYSQRQLSRIIKNYTGLTPVNFILELKLQRAYYLIKERRYSTISEVRYDVGIESASYFSKKFTERFGVRPSELT